MENRFDRVSARLSNEQLRYRIENPKAFEAEAVLSAAEELQRRNESGDYRTTIDSYSRELEQKKKLTDEAIKADQEILEFYQKQLKGKPAEFWRRLVAYLLDSIIVIVLFFIIVNILAKSFRFHKAEDVRTLMRMTSLFLWLIYFILFESSSLQATPGKLIMKLKVVNREGEKITVIRAFLRYLARLLSMIILGIGYLFMLSDIRKTALHDILTRTSVIYRADRFDTDLGEDQLLDFNIDSL